jgi:hypothetical protein
VRNRPIAIPPGPRDGDITAPRYSNAAESMEYWMSKKKSRAWFVCGQWPDIISQHYANDAEAATALKCTPQLLTRLRAGTPVARSTLFRVLRRLASQHDLGSVPADLVTDTRSR